MIEITLAADAWTDVEPDTEALVDEWLVSVGDTVRAGQPIANVFIIKTKMEIVAPVDGCIEEILVRSEETFGQGEPIALLKEST
jgi:pyruvate/2-oxoglutarate dehydrogenase complex dihydrolipoamide acyltransferase (E2) component